MHFLYKIVVKGIDFAEFRPMYFIRLAKAEEEYQGWLIIRSSAPNHFSSVELWGLRIWGWRMIVNSTRAV